MFGRVSYIQDKSGFEFSSVFKSVGPVAQRLEQGTHNPINVASVAFQGFAKRWNRSTYTRLIFA